VKIIPYFALVQGSISAIWWKDGRFIDFHVIIFTAQQAGSPHHI